MAFKVAFHSNSRAMNKMNTRSCAQDHFCSGLSIFDIPRALGIIRNVSTFNSLK